MATVARDSPRGGLTMQRSPSDRGMVGKLAVGPDLSRGSPTMTRNESEKAGSQHKDSPGSRIPRHLSNGNSPTLGMPADGATRTYSPTPRWTEGPPAPYTGPAPMAASYAGPGNLSAPYNGAAGMTSSYSGQAGLAAPYTGQSSSPYVGYGGASYGGPVYSPYVVQGGPSHNGSANSAYGNSPEGPPTNGTGNGGWSGARFTGSEELRASGSGDLPGSQGQLHQSAGPGEQMEYVANPIWPTHAERSGSGSGSSSGFPYQAPGERSDSPEGGNGPSRRSFSRTRSLPPQTQAQAQAQANGAGGNGEGSGSSGGTPNGTASVAGTSGRADSPPQMGEPKPSRNGIWGGGSSGRQMPPPQQHQQQRPLPDSNGDSDFGSSDPAHREARGSFPEPVSSPKPRPSPSSSPAKEPPSHGLSSQDAYTVGVQNGASPERVNRFVPQNKISPEQLNRFVPQNGASPELFTRGSPRATDGMNRATNGHLVLGQSYLAEGAYGVGGMAGEGSYVAVSPRAGNGLAPRPTARWQAGSESLDMQNGVHRAGGLAERLDSLAARTSLAGSGSFQRSASSERLDGGASGRSLREKSYSDPLLQTQGHVPPKPRSPPQDQPVTGPSQLSPPQTPTEMTTATVTHRLPSPMRTSTNPKSEGYDWPTFGVMTRSDSFHRMESSQRSATPTRSYINSSPQGADSLALPSGTITVLRSTRSISPSPRSQAPAPSLALPQVSATTSMSPSGTSSPPGAPPANGIRPVTPADKDKDKDLVISPSPSSLDMGGPLPRRSQSDMQSLRTSMQALQATVQGMASTVHHLAQFQQLQAKFGPGSGGHGNVQDAIARLEDNFKASIAQLTALILHKDEQQQARLCNLGSVSDNDPLCPLPNDKGVIPELFPPTRLALEELSPEATLVLAEHYGLPLEPAGERLARLGRFVGLRM